MHVDDRADSLGVLTNVLVTQMLACVKFTCMGTQTGVTHKAVTGEELCEAGACKGTAETTPFEPPTDMCVSSTFQGMQCLACCEVCGQV